MKLICWLCFVALMFCAGASVPAQNAAGDLPANGGELSTTAVQQDKNISRQESTRPKWEQELNGKLDSVLLKVVFDSLKQKNVLPESELLSSWESNLSAVRKQALLRELKGDKGRFFSYGGTDGKEYYRFTNGTIVHGDRMETLKGSPPTEQAIAQFLEGIARDITASKSLPELLGCVVEQTANPEQALPHYLAGLQSASAGSDVEQRLREKIIRLVQQRDAKPALPEEAERRIARGQAAVKEAQTPKDFEDAAIEFTAASKAAPWVPEIYYNLGILLDKVGRHSDAIRNLKLYLLAAPNAPDAKGVRTLIYEIEYRQEKAGKATPTVSATRVPAEKPRLTWEFLVGVWVEWRDGVEYARHEFHQADGQIERRTLSAPAVVRLGGSFDKGWRAFSPRQWFGTYDGEKYVLPDLAGEIKEVNRFTRIISPSLIVSETDFIFIQTGKTQHMRTEWRKLEQ